MPRPKGSKNRKNTEVQIDSLGNIEEKIAAVEADIASITEDLKAKKAELKTLVKAREKAAKIAAEKKAEEDKETILAAVAASGKSVDEILEMLK